MNTITTVVYDGDEWPESLVEFITWLQGHLALIPAEFHADAEIHISTSGYDGDSPTMEVTYRRPETEEDRRKRELADAQQRKATQEREIEKLRNLQKKYPNIR